MGLVGRGHGLLWERKGSLVFAPGPGGSVKRPQPKAVLQHPLPQLAGSPVLSWPSHPCLQHSPCSPTLYVLSCIWGSFSRSQCPLPAPSPRPSVPCTVPLRWHGCPWVGTSMPVPPPHVAVPHPSDHTLGAGEVGSRSGPLVLWYVRLALGAPSF